MDGSVSPTVDADINDVCEFLLKIENASYPTRKRSVIKYTKLPDFDFDTQVSWPRSNSYMLQPRVRRIIEVDDRSLHTTRSLKSNPMTSSKINTTSYTKRKIVTIAENEENSHIIDQFKSIIKPSGTDLKDGKNAVKRSTSRLTNPPKYSRVSKLSAITNNIPNKTDDAVSKTSFRSKSSSNNLSAQENSRFRNSKGREPPKNLFKPTGTTVKVNVSKNLVISSESGKNAPFVDKKSIAYSKHPTTTKQSSCKITDRNRVKKLPESKTLTVTNEINFKTTPLPIIHVPLDNQNEIKNRNASLSSSSSDVIEKHGIIDVLSNTHSNSVSSLEHPVNTTDRATDMGILVNSMNPEISATLQDMQVSTSPRPTMLNQETETTQRRYGDYCELQDSYIQTELTKEIFDNLDMPNVTLTKDKNNYSKADIVTYCSSSSHKLQMPNFKIRPEEDDNVNHDSLRNSKSYIIGRVTYTTKQKIDIHVVGNDENSSNQMPSPLDYPLNVVSVFKSKLNNCEKPQRSEETDRKEEHDHCHNLHDLKALNCSYDLNRGKLVKPSDLISNLTVNHGLLQNDYVCEQFQRELHFIDSFFESLQYLESCSLSEKGFTQDKCENWVKKTGFELENSDYNSFLCKLENGANALAHVDDMETMASRSLCLLNLLIRDEQRRAKNLLFVLKMREDALKDFTKSQIIWLENKKKQENTDVSTLKKKQRGALLKLQHECGEMHRMRKALLTLSEKRKAALMKTRNNIELKLKNNVDVDQILLGKKKLKRNSAVDRNVAPLKCFDLSSSGCDDSTSSKHKLETPAPLQDHEPVISSVEKSIQTSHSILETVNQTTDTAAENFVAVDGVYLNILFQNLSLPQIFSGGKQYEVNEEALRNIVKSSNSANQKIVSDSDVVGNFMEKLRSRESDRSSSPSTAHSLVDEYDQYYKGLGEGSKSPVDSPDAEYHERDSVFEIKDMCVQVVADKVEQCEMNTERSTSSIATHSADTLVDAAELAPPGPPCCCDVSSAEVPSRGLEVPVVQSPTGPLPVPPGAAAPTDPMPNFLPTTTDGASGQPPPAAPGAAEAEELRRQQLAIEREIKALEQQQCQLLAVREIPDKPPPPYTPPLAPHAPPRAFALDAAARDRLRAHIVSGTELVGDPSDSFDTFMLDICRESLCHHQTEISDQPWDACNLLPPKQEVSREVVSQKAIAEIEETLSPPVPTVVSGVGSRRSDHIDDILFAEWRRVEPQWTALHADEAAVKNQVFESIFQKVLSETIDRYKTTVLCLTEPTE